MFRRLGGFAILRFGFSVVFCKMHWWHARESFSFLHLQPNERKKNWYNFLKRLLFYRYSHRKSLASFLREHFVLLLLQMWVALAEKVFWCIKHVPVGRSVDDLTARLHSLIPNNIFFFFCLLRLHHWALPKIYQPSIVRAQKIMQMCIVYFREWVERCLAIIPIGGWMNEWVARELTLNNNMICGWFWWEAVSSSNESEKKWKKWNEAREWLNQLGSFFFNKLHGSNRFNRRYLAINLGWTRAQTLYIDSFTNDVHNVRISSVDEIIFAKTKSNISTTTCNRIGQYLFWKWQRVVQLIDWIGCNVPSKRQILLALLLSRILTSIFLWNDVSDILSKGWILAVL